MVERLSGLALLVVGLGMVLASDALLGKLFWLGTVVVPGCMLITERGGRARKRDPEIGARMALGAGLRFDVAVDGTPPLRLDLDARQVIVLYPNRFTVIPFEAVRGVDVIEQQGQGVLVIRMAERAPLESLLPDVAEAQAARQALARALPSRLASL